MTLRYFTGSLASTLFLELSGHVFVTLTTIIQSLFFYTKLEKMFMYITKSKRINTNILLTILRLMHFHLFYVAKYSGTY